jgi:hypothetical protein
MPSFERHNKSHYFDPDVIGKNLDFFDASTNEDGALTIPGLQEEPLSSPITEALHVVGERSPNKRNPSIFDFDMYVEKPQKSGVHPPTRKVSRRRSGALEKMFQEVDMKANDTNNVTLSTTPEDRSIGSSGVRSVRSHKSSNKSIKSTGSRSKSEKGKDGKSIKTSKSAGLGSRSEEARDGSARRSQRPGSSKRLNGERRRRSNSHEGNSKAVKQKSLRFQKKFEPKQTEEDSLSASAGEIEDTALLALSKDSSPSLGSTPSSKELKKIGKEPPPHPSQRGQSLSPPPNPKIRKNLPRSGEQQETVLPALAVSSLSGMAPFAEPKSAVDESTRKPRRGKRRGDNDSKNRHPSKSAQPRNEGDGEEKSRSKSAQPRNEGDGEGKSRSKSAQRRNEGDSKSSSRSKSAPRNTGGGSKTDDNPRSTRSSSRRRNTEDRDAPRRNKSTSESSRPRSEKKDSKESTHHKHSHSEKDHGGRRARSPPSASQGAGREKRTASPRAGLRPGKDEPPPVSDRGFAK